jgi:hypothetical protein
MVENEEATMEKCGVEGLDKSVLAWSTSYFAASVLGFIALHIWWKSSLQVIGGIAFVCMAVAFVINGIAIRFNGNNGTDDGKGVKGLFIAATVYYFLMTISAFLFAFIGHQAWHHYESTRPRFCGRSEMSLFVFLIFISAFVVIIGGVTTLARGDDVLVTDENPDDPYPDDPYQVPMSLEVTEIGSMIWNACHSLFLISLAIVLGMTAKSEPVTIGGLPNSLAAGGVVLLQCAVGIFRIILLSISASQDTKESMIYSVAPAIFNYSFLMSAFFIHNLIVTLFPNNDEIYVSKHGSQYSMENEEVDDFDAQQIHVSTGTATNSMAGLPSSRRNRTVSQLNQSETESFEQASKTAPPYGHTTLESEGVEVMGIPASKVSQKTFGILSTKLMSLLGGNQNQPSTSASLRQSPEVKNGHSGAINLSVDAGQAESPVTSFGSQILHKIKNGSLSSFGSQSLHKTNFSSQVVRKGKSPADESGSETTFGSQMLQKVKIDLKGITKPPEESNNILERAMGDVSSHLQKNDESETGSQVVKKEKPPAYGRDSENNFGSQMLQKVKGKQIVYEDASFTTFGSEMLQKVRPAYDDASETTFGSQMLQKVRMIYHKDESTFRAQMPQKEKMKQNPVIRSQAALNNIPEREMTDNEKNDAESETTFGSQVLKKENSRVFRSGFEKTSGSQMMQNVRIKQPVYEDASLTTFGSEMLQKRRPTYEDASETTFGSEMLQKVRRANNTDDTAMEEAGVEIIGVPRLHSTNRGLPMLNRLMTKKQDGIFLQAKEESLGSVNRFGSDSLQRVKNPEYESESDDTVTSFGSELLMKVKPRRLKHESEDSVAGRSTTFGSERLIKVRPKLKRSENDGSVTTFGSEVKAKVEHRACETMPMTAVTATEATKKQRSNVSPKLASAAISMKDLDSERDRPSSSRLTPHKTATDPAHLRNVDKVYNWMSKFLPMEGIKNASLHNAVAVDGETVESVREEFEIELGALHDDNAEAPKDTAPALMSRLRPTRKKKSYRKKYQHSRQEIDIPNAIDEDMDEESTTASSNGNECAQRLATMSGDAGIVSNKPMGPLPMLEDGEDSCHSFSTGTPVLGTYPFEDEILTEFLESRDDVYWNNPYERDSFSHTMPSAAHSEFGDYDADMTSSVSSVYLNKIPLFPSMDKE